MGSPPVITKSTEDKYKNFKHDLTPTSFDLVIEDVEDGDGGVYSCAVFGNPPVEFDVTVEVLAKPTVQYESQDVVELDVIVGTQYNLTCSATRARSVSDLSLMWDPSLVEPTPLSSTPNGDYMDYSITSTYTAVKGDSSITCQLTGYVMQDEINDQRMDNISHTVNLNVQLIAFRYSTVMTPTVIPKDIQVPSPELTSDVGLNLIGPTTIKCHSE
ncbi:hypothetical protein BSL78_00598 [Apostichopus japonicus]|uniref:Ig-like domain-containing protein n=1 Tax=Stichopus japonicus TaxID=307972 RepID=A0A2G8LQK3_STIJA|nr:hypothetical protein BSL78_00598 [Apostichopus japonicus]